MNLDSQLKCSCGRNKDAFQVLLKLGYNRKKLVANFRNYKSKILNILPKLRCVDCNKIGEIKIVEIKGQFKPKIKLAPKLKQIFIGTDRGKGRIFHKNNCYFAQKIKREDEIHFSKREDAIKMFFDPCKTCKP